jgi:hypothetical protein
MTTYILCYGWNGPAIYRQTKRGRVVRMTFIAEYGDTPPDARLAEAICAELNKLNKPAP